MVTIGDLIKQGIIKEYIPPKGGNHAVIKKPRASPVLQDLFPSVFQAWLDSDRATKKAAHIPKGTDGKSESY